MSDGPVVHRARVTVEGAHCCVCGKPLGGRVQMLGGRPYCDLHYANATYGSPGHWVATGAMLGGLIVLALVMLAVGGRISDGLGTAPLAAIGLALAVVPAALWLGIFRQLDRLEPEPRQYLIDVLVLAALFTGAIGEPIRRGYFHLQLWQPDGARYAIPVYALIQGAIQALIVYVTVRATVFLSDEFDERADGVIYGTAAGLGVATLLNFNYVLDHHGLQLDVGTSRMIVAALVQASLGGIIGHGLGKVKFERHKAWYPALFVALAALLNGLFEWLQRQVSIQGFHYRAWPSVAVAAVFAALTLAFVYALLRRDVAATLALAGNRPATSAEG